MQSLEAKNAPTSSGPFSYDPNEVGVAGCGDFTLELPAVTPMASTSGERFRVIARDGLVLRSGPGTDFVRLRTMPFGTILFVLSRSGDWALVDLQGDGRADGHCHPAF